MTQTITKLSLQAQKINPIKETLGELTEEDVRVQVLFSNINKSDLMLLEGKNRSDFFGTEVVGKVVAVGKNVGHCKVGQVVGIYHSNTNCGKFQTGFCDYVQVTQDRVIYIPESFQPCQAAVLLGSGTTAFNAVQKLDKNSHIAVVGTNNLAALTIQFAKKVAGCKVTVFAYEGSEEQAKQLGADGFIELSKKSIQANGQKFKSVVIADVVKEEEAFCLQDITERNGNVIFSIDMGYSPTISTLDFMCGQKAYQGVKRGAYGQAVKALKAAAYHGIRSKVQVFEASNYEAAFEKAKLTGVGKSIALKY